jgi:hypothetical protein
MRGLGRSRPMLLCAVLVALPAAPAHADWGAPIDLGVH